MAVSFKLFRLIRWSASSGKRPRRLPPQIRPTLRRVKRARNEISGGWRRSGGRGEREQKRNVRAHLLSVHPSSCVTRLPLRFIPGRRARSMDGYIYIYFFSFSSSTSFVHPLFFLKLFKKDLYDSIDILFFFLSHFWSFIRIYIRFYILAIFYMFLVFLLSGCLRKVEFLRQEMGRFKQRFALLFYAFFVHSADFRVFNIFHECINMVRYVYYFI